MSDFMKKANVAVKSSRERNIFRGPFVAHS